MTDWVAVGICLRDVTAWGNYVCDGTTNSIVVENSSKGAYLLTYKGQLVSHFKKEDKGKQTKLHYQSGDLLHVEFHPQTGKIIYSKEGSPVRVEQATNIGPSTTEPVHFAVVAASHHTDVMIAG